jgi:tRNA (cytosine34-C5)-methyltransferase
MSIFKNYFLTVTMGYTEFVDFYKNVLNFNEDEWTTFIQSIKTPLPSAMRITASKFKKKIQDAFVGMTKNEYFTDVYDTIYRGSLLKDLIINQTNVGNIQRQEVVSMLPVLLMNLEVDHSVLDMCAAPGSKTKQLLEFVGDKGLVVANDCSSKRLNILVTETCKTPHKSFMVLKHDASFLPVFKTDFDRVLCDVPCSGDGTSRKNPEVIPTWNINNSLSLCNLQYKILKRALKFVKHDGLIIYSTCSMNPIENECIVQRVVLEEDLEIVDLRDNVNEKFLSKKFKFREGLTKWDLEVKEHKGLNLEPVEKDIGLSKCIRVYPHDQNTGGFFIVGLRKKIKKDYEVKNRVPRFTVSEIDDKLKQDLEKEYDIRDRILVQKDKGLNVIYEVSKTVLDLIKKNKLNVIYCGYKIFERCNLTVSKYRMKNILNEVGKIPYNLEIEGSCMVEGIKNKEIPLPFNKGSVVIKFKEYDILVSGYSYGNKINLYISNNLQKALLDFQINKL